MVQRVENMKNNTWLVMGFNNYVLSRYILQQLPIQVLQYGYPPKKYSSSNAWLREQMCPKVSTSIEVLDKIFKWNSLGFFGTTDAYYKPYDEENCFVRTLHQRWERLKKT